MRKTALLFALLLLPAQAAPARQDPALLAELNRDLWTPFSEAFAGQSPDKLLALLAPEFIRIEGGQRMISPLADYAREMRRSFGHWEESNLKVAVTFRFVERIVRGDFASERGVLEFVLQDADGNAERTYTRFHLLARKIEGRWRIIVNYDHDEDGRVALPDFTAAAAPDNFRRF